jgi:antitoxin YefM
VRRSGFTAAADGWRYIVFPLAAKFTQFSIKSFFLPFTYLHVIVQHLVILEVVMQAISYSEARHELKTIMDDACNNHEPILITRRKGESVVLVSLEDYESIMESEYLLSSPANASRLLQSLEEARSGRRTPMDALGI